MNVPWCVMSATSIPGGAWHACDECAMALSWYICDAFTIQHVNGATTAPSGNF